MGVCIHLPSDRLPSRDTRNTYECLKFLSMFSTMICKHHPKFGGNNVFVRQQEVVLVVLPVGLRISDSGNSSKFEVSSMLLISIDIAAGLSLPRQAKNYYG